MDLLATRIDKELFRANQHRGVISHCMAVVHLGLLLSGVLDKCMLEEAFIRSPFDFLHIMFPCLVFMFDTTDVQLCWL